MKPNPVREKSFQFAVDAVRLCRSLRDPVIRSLVIQFLDSATSVGANVEEAQAGQSRKDFLSKMSIASKESREANYWLRVFRAAGVLPEGTLDPLLSRSSELVRMLTSIVRTTGESSPAPRNSKLRIQNSKLPGSIQREETHD